MSRRKRWLPPSPHCTARCRSALHCCCSQNPHPTPRIHPRHPLLSPSCKEQERPVRPQSVWSVLQRVIPESSSEVRFLFGGITQYSLDELLTTGLHCWLCAVWKERKKYHLARVRHPGSGMVSIHKVTQSVI